MVVAIWLSLWDWLLRRSRRCAERCSVYYWVKAVILLSLDEWYLTPQIRILFRSLHCRHLFAKRKWDCQLYNHPCLADCLPALHEHPCPCGPLQGICVPVRLGNIPGLRQGIRAEPPKRQLLLQGWQHCVLKVGKHFHASRLWLILCSVCIIAFFLLLPSLAAFHIPTQYIQSLGEEGPLVSSLLFSLYMLF